MPTTRPPGTRRWLWAGAAVYLAVLATVSIALLHLQHTARDRLDQALGERLLGVAVTAVHLVDGDSLRTWSLDFDESLELLWTRTRLEAVRRENRLSELTLCDREGFVLVSAAGRLKRGDLNVYWELDPDAVAAAREGLPAAGALVRVGSGYQKSAHAPVTDASGRTVGVISAEAEAGFFDALAGLQRGAWITLAATLAFLTLLAVVLLRLLRSVARARAEMQRQEALAAMGRMTAGIAHEIRNPLGIIRAAGEIQATKLREAGIELPTLDFIPDEVDRLDRILTRYLTFGKGERIEPEPLDLERLVRRVVRMAESELERTGVRVEVVNRGLDEPVPADSPGLQQVLLNLLLNARDAMPDGGTVAIALSRDGRNARLSLCDEGVGLGAVAPGELFVPFHTTKEKGSGLGLAIVRRVVEDHGGTVALHDREDGRGAEAVVTLPLGPAAPVAGEEETWRAS